MPYKKKRKAPDRSRRNQFVFQHAAVALWEQDISALRSFLSGWKKASHHDLRCQLLKRPNLLLEAVGSIETVQVNESALRLYGAASPEELRGLWDPTLDGRSEAACIEMVCAVAQGRESLRCQCSGRTLEGRPLELLLSVHIPKKCEGYPFMLVNAIDLAREQERDRMRALIDSLPDCIFMKNHRHQFLLANRTLADVMGAKGQEELIGKTDRDYYPAERAASFETEEKRVIERGETLVNKAESWSVKGAPRWFIVTKVPLRDREDKIVGLVGISRDVTEQKAVEDALARERTYLAALMDSSTDHIYFKDRQSRFLLINEALADAFRLEDPKEAVGKTDFDFFSTQHAQSAFDDEQRIIQTGEPIVNIEERETWPDRPDTWVSTTKLPLREGQGAITGTFGVSRDVTQRRHMEERNLRLAAMVEYSNDAIIGIDLEDTVTSWNSGAERVFGYAAAEMVG